MVRAAAAAANGHAGAQLSVLEDKCIGAKVSVWWPLDEAWYTGTVSGRCVYVFNWGVRGQESVDRCIDTRSACGGNWMNHAVRVSRCTLVGSQCAWANNQHGWVSGTGAIGLFCIHKSPEDASSSSSCIRTPALWHMRRGAEYGRCLTGDHSATNCALLPHQKSRQKFMHSSVNNATRGGSTAGGVMTSAVSSGALAVDAQHS